MLEYLSNGNLLSFLHNSHDSSSENEFQDVDKRHLNQKTLLTFALDIARGMKFLASENVRYPIMLFSC